MDDKTLNLKFHGRRKINSSRKSTYSITGTVQLIIGIIGLIMSNFELNTSFLLFLILTIVGI